MTPPGSAVATTLAPGTLATTGGMACVAAPSIQNHVSTATRLSARGAMLISWSGILASISSMATIANASGETASNRRHDAARSSMAGGPGT